MTGPTQEAVAPGCWMPCDSDCEVGPVHCGWWHEPNHKPGWHDPRECRMPDAAPAQEAATPGQAAPGWKVPAPGNPWTAPQSVPELPGYWRARAEGAQRGAHVRSVDYQRGAAFRTCARDLEDALAAENASLREQLARAEQEHDEIVGIYGTVKDERDAAREQLDEIRAMVRAAPALASAEQLGIVLRAIHEAAALEATP